MMRLLLCVVVVLAVSVLPARAQFAPLLMTPSIGGQAVSSSNPQPVALAQGGTLVTLAQQHTANFNEGGGDPVNVSIYGSALPGPSGPVAVGHNNPFPVYYPTLPSVGVTSIGGRDLTYNPCADPLKVQRINIDLAAPGGTNTSTQHVAVDGSKRIFPCDFWFQLGGAGKLTMRFGSGTNCADNTNNWGTILAADNADGLAHSFPTPSPSDPARAFCTLRTTDVSLTGAFFYVLEADS